VSEERRPSPDALLEEIRKASRGRLKIFLGMCPGVGKTYAMLLSAQQRQEEGVRVVIGYLETHGRVETTAVAAGMPRVPRRKVKYRDVELEEMDLDAILQSKPALVLVDELAHSNVAGGRHPKRWQDVVEILDAGIDVFTTLNVQHIESYRDVVTQITGAPASEAVPDSMIDLAEEIELIDISPQELRKRLADGKVYLNERAAAAALSFFRDGNLRALREIALRIATEKADSELRDFLSAKSISGPWKAGERFLVAVGTSPFSGHLIRWTRRVCALTHGTWMAVFIDNGAVLGAEERQRLDKNLALARSLGAEVLATVGTDIAGTLLRVARENNATQIVVGKPLGHPWIDFLRGGSLVDKLIRGSGDIDIFVVRAEKAAHAPHFSLGRPDWPKLARESGWGLLGVLAMTIVGLFLNPYLGYASVGLIYLLGVLAASMFLSRWPILLTAACTALAWDFLFIPPHFTLFIGGAHDVILFVTYFVVALVAGSFTGQLRAREAADHRREAQATALYRFSRAVVESETVREGIERGLSQIDMLFDCASSVLAGEEGSLKSLAGETLTASETAVAAWALERGQAAGRFTDTLPQAAGLYLPLRAGGDPVGVLGLRLARALTLPERELIETFAAQLGLLIERERHQRNAEQARLREKSESLERTLLDSVSHEFRTPLAVITGAADELERSGELSRSLVGEIRIAARRLHRVVGNLLDITRIETGSIRAKSEWCDLEDVIGDAVARVGEEISGRRVSVDVADAVAAVQTDAGLLEEVLSNLLRNAAQHSPVESLIQVLASAEPGGVGIRVIDEGPGVAGDAVRIFEKFHRGEGARVPGLGLGLSIVRGLVDCLGGTVQARPRADGQSGAEFQIVLSVPVRSLESFETAR
jgi:two-component system sensor histidine kinase KdpD